MSHDIPHTFRAYEAISASETGVDKKFEAIPIIEDYATKPIEEGFDWEEIIFRVKQENEISLKESLYLVVFRSQRRFEEEAGERFIPDELLAELDEGVLREARGSSSEESGFLYYFSGKRDEDGNNISFCLWTSGEAVQKTSLGPDHHKAKLAARDAYKAIDFSAYDVSQGVDGKIVHTLVFNRQY
jgi:hypothetical protein